jgi:Uma2 family endonuclease
LSRAPNQPLSPAPDICVEILSPSNTQAEIDQKRALPLTRTENACRRALNIMKQADSYNLRHSARVD